MAALPKADKDSKPRLGIKNLVPQFSLTPPLDWQGLQTRFPLDIRVAFITFAASLLVLAPVVFFLPPAFLPQSAVPMAASGHSAEITANKSGAEAAAGEAATAPQLKSPEDYTEREKQAITTNEKIGSESLGPAPIDALEENHASGKIPTTAADGRKPWYAYSRPFDNNDPRPKIALIVGELGYSRVLADAAIAELPGAVTLAFSSYADAAADWMMRARGHGHETLLTLAMEPLDYPASDPGPGSILTKNSQQMNLERLRDMLARGSGYVGVTTLSGSRMTSSPKQLEPVLAEINKRGLMFMDARTTPLSSAFAIGTRIGLPVVDTDFHVAADLSQEQLNYLFLEIEQAAAHRKMVTAIVAPSPLVLRKLIEWTGTLSGKGYALAPITAFIGHNTK